MYRAHLVRVGVMGNVGRFASPDGVHYPRGARVIVRTVRGLERGEVLAPDMLTVDGSVPNGSADGTLLRAMTVEDELLAARLARHREDAYLACARRIAELQLPTVLLDVEHLFDGRTLAFYFLGEVPAEMESLTAELAELYDAEAHFRDFAHAVEAGCGPGCGTEHAENGCGSLGSGCSTCATGCAVKAGARRGSGTSESC